MNRTVEGSSWGWFRAGRVAPQARALRLPRGRSWGLGERPAILGVVNVTPDSFSDGGRFVRAAGESSGAEFVDVRAAVETGLRLLDDGADALDIGGESTRPGAESVPTGEQLRRVLPVIEGLRRETDAPLSVDTTLPDVAREAIAAGADIVNDVAGFRHPEWETVLRTFDGAVILMHMRGTPRTMQERPEYPRGAVVEVKEFFRERLAVLDGWGLGPGRCVLDPGIGFGKRLQHNLELVRNIEELRVSEYPVLIGLSRKRFIGEVLDRDIQNRDPGTLAANAAAVAAGADILRVHNVSWTADLVRMLGAIGATGGGGPDGASPDGAGRDRRRGAGTGEGRS